MYSKKDNYINWITIFLLIANTANVFFYLSIEMVSISTVILLVLWYLKDGEKSYLNKYFFVFAGLLMLLQLLQSLTFELFTIKSFLGEYLRIAFAIIALKILGDAFPQYFVKFVTVFAIISLCFYIPSVLIKGLAPFFIKNVAKYLKCPFVPAVDAYYGKEGIIIFNFGQIDLNRNSGFYWEPGTHGGFLILALFLNIYYNRSRLLSRSNLILMFTILTTLSTTTYITLFVLLVISLKDFLLKRPVLSLLIFLVMVSSALILYNKLDFLNNKIHTQIEKTNTGVAGESRFTSFFADMRSLADHPIIGTGRSVEMKFGRKFYNLTAAQLHRNNGIGVLLATYGIFYFLLFFYLNWLSFRKMLDQRGAATIGLLLLLLIGFSEDYFFKVFFLALALYPGITMISQHANTRLSYKKMRLVNEENSKLLT